MSDPTPLQSDGPVQDRRVRPPGVLPKNTQALVITGIALVMVLVIAFSGRNPPKARPPVSTAPGVDATAARIEAYKTQIEQEAQQLQMEKAQLARTQSAYGS